MPDGAWAYVYDAIRAQYATRTGKDREWPEELAVLHLRWLMGERRTGRLRAADWPTVRELQAEWGWTSRTGKPALDRVSTFIATEHTVTVEREKVTCPQWQDGYRPMSLEELRGERSVPANAPGARQKPTETRQEPDRNPTDGTGEPTESEPNPDKNRQEPDRNPTLRASSPRASTFHSPPLEGGSRGSVGEVDTSPVEIPGGRTVPGDIPALLPQLGQLHWLRLVHNGVRSARELLRIEAGRLRYTRGIGEAMALAIEAELRRQDIPPGCLAEPASRGPPKPLGGLLPTPGDRETYADALEASEQRLMKEIAEHAAQST